MNDELIRRIIKEQLQKVLFEAPSPSLKDKAIEKLHKLGATASYGKWYSKAGEYLGKFNKKDQWMPANKDPESQQKKPKKPNNNLDKLKANVPEETPDWQRDEKYGPATKLADDLALLATDKEGIWASPGEGDEPIAIAQYSKNPNAPLVPFSGLPKELAADISAKISDAQNSEDSEQEPQPEPQAKKPKNPNHSPQDAGVPNLKDKKVYSVDPKQRSQVYDNPDTGISDSEWFANAKNRKAKIIDIPNAQFSKKEINAFFENVPKKYHTVLTRLLTTEKKPGFSITDVISGAGAGEIASQGGEIIAMISTSIKDDAVADAFLNKLLDVTSNYPKGYKPIVDKSWVQSAAAVRKITHKRFNFIYGDNWKVDAAGWDVENEVEAMGLKDYKINKGYSTDMYMTIKNSDGEVIMDEISLKKNLVANFLNSTTSFLGEFALLASDDGGEYMALKDEYLPLSQKERSTKSGKELLNRIKELLEKHEQKIDGLANYTTARRNQKELQSQLKQGTAGKEFSKIVNSIKKMDKKQLSTVAEKFVEGLRGRGITKSPEDDVKKVLNILRVSKNYPPELSKEEAKKFGFDDTRKRAKLDVFAGFLTSAMGNAPATDKVLDALYKNSMGHANEVMKSIGENEQLKEGMLVSIREKFPLKALFEGEEYMALGGVSCDPNVLKEIFPGIQDFSEIQDGLTVETAGDGMTSLVYKAKAGHATVPIAQIKSRPDGTGYGDTWKLELTMHPKFAKQLKTTNRKLYEHLSKVFGDFLVDTTVSDFKVTPLLPLSNIIEDIEENTPMNLFLEEIENGIYID